MDVVRKGERWVSGEFKYFSLSSRLNGYVINERIIIEERVVLGEMMINVFWIYYVWWELWWGENFGDF